jgi:hypothetical protein
MIRLLVLLSALATVPVPDGKYILVNGMVGPREWDGAACVRLDAETEIRAMKDPGSLFLAVVFKGPHHTGIDLYLRSASKVRMLHVSSALGERSMHAGSWSDIEWGRNHWWTANAIGMVSEEGGSRWLEPEAFEFQLARDQLGLDAELFVHLKRPEKKLPPGASAGNADGWLHLVL